MLATWGQKECVSNLGSEGGVLATWGQKEVC